MQPTTTHATPAGHEAALARAGVRAGLAIGIPLVVVAALWRGAPGAWTGLGGLAVVLGLTAGSGVASSWAARLGPEILHAVALGGVLLRFALYGVLLVLLRPVADGPALALVVVPLTIVVLVAEVRHALANEPLWWVQPQPAGARSVLADGKERA